MSKMYLQSDLGDNKIKQSTFTKHTDNNQKTHGWTLSKTIQHSSWNKSHLITWWCKRSETTNHFVSKTILTDNEHPYMPIVFTEADEDLQQNNSTCLMYKMSFFSWKVMSNNCITIWHLYSPHLIFECLYHHVSSMDLEIYQDYQVESLLHTMH